METRGAGGPRTLSNTIVTRWSWPCVLVFVNGWTVRGAAQETRRSRAVASSHAGRPHRADLCGRSAAAPAGERFVDVGLVELDDVRGWTAQIFGVGELGEPIDLNETTVDLGLIGCPVHGFGAAGSCAMRGQIMGLMSSS
jgi:hypothetical protein